MKFLITKSKHEINLPLNTLLCIGGQTVEVLGLAKTEEKDGLLWQWWIVTEGGMAIEY